MYALKAIGAAEAIDAIKLIWTFGNQEIEERVAHVLERMLKETGE
jgi:hypothetical protein